MRVLKLYLHLITEDLNQFLVAKLGIGGLLGWSANYLQTPGLLQTFLISLKITSAEQTRTTAMHGFVTGQP